MLTRDILAKLMSISLRQGKTINFEKALGFPLSQFVQCRWKFAENQQKSIAQKDSWNAESKYPA